MRVYERRFRLKEQQDTHMCPVQQSVVSRDTLKSDKLLARQSLT